VLALLEIVARAALIRGAILEIAPRLRYLYEGAWEDSAGKVRKDWKKG
jgi:hypothetical protein